MNKNKLFQKNDNSSLPNNQSSIFDEKYIIDLADRVQRLAFSLDETKKDYQSMKDELTRLSKEVESLKSQPKFIVNKTDCVDDLSTDDEQKLKTLEEPISPGVVKEKEIDEWLYFSTPLKGAFNLSAKMKQGDSKICYRVNPNTRIIEFIHSSMDSILISYKNEYLLPVCDIINSPASPSSIKMESAGKVIKLGDEFVIDQTQKIKIKLI